LRTLLKLIFVVLLAAAGWLAYGLLLPAKPRSEFVMLRSGWSTRRIAQELQNAGAIRSARAFLIYHVVVSPKPLKAGEYRFAQPATALNVHRRIVAGDIYTHTVIIPEGYSIFDIAGVIEAAGLGSRDEFLALAKSSATMVHDIDPQATSLEGYLFPDTYQFTRTQTLTDMLHVMVRRFRQEAKAIGLLNGHNEPGRVHRLVTMASIIEKETGAAEERANVASVYYNRLERRIALQADPTVIYAALLAGRYDGVIHQSDLQFDSPYNTYRYAGLPPGPIANAGRASLEAALRPASTDFIYFVSDNAGRHRFARSLEEHTHNVALYRRALTAAGSSGAAGK